MCQFINSLLAIIGVTCSMRRKKETKFFRCPFSECGMFFPNKREYLEHLDTPHCPICGFTIGISAINHITTEFMCPACKLDNAKFPISKLKTQ